MLKQAQMLKSIILPVITRHCVIGSQDLQELLCINYVPVDLIKFHDT